MIFKDIKNPKSTDWFVYDWHIDLKMGLYSQTSLNCYSKVQYKFHICFYFRINRVRSFLMHSFLSGLALETKYLRTFNGKGVSL